MILDSQVHAYERNHPGRPWIKALAGSPEVTGQDQVAAMDAAGVDGALLMSPYTTYGFDSSYVVEVYKQYPDRFALVAPMDFRRSDVAEAMAAQWIATPGAVGFRFLPHVGDQHLSVESPGVGPVMRAATRHAFPVCIQCWEQLPLVGQMAAAFPDTQLVIDHMGIRQPLQPPPPPNPFADLGNLLALAKYPNVAVKVSGTATLSHQPYPFEDLWEPLARVFDAFGFDRCMWGTDWTRATALVSYPEAVRAFRDTNRLSADERAALLGKTLQRVFRWSPRPNAR